MGSLLSVSDIKEDVKYILDLASKIKAGEMEEKPLEGKTLVLAAGYSHLVKLPIPEGLEVKVPTPTEINISGIDKQVVGQFAAEARAVREPEPYLGKGIRYSDEIIRRKEGKKAK